MWMGAGCHLLLLGRNCRYIERNRRRELQKASDARLIGIVQYQVSAAIGILRGRLFGIEVTSHQCCGHKVAEWMPNGKPPKWT